MENKNKTKTSQEKFEIYYEFQDKSVVKAEEFDMSTLTDIQKEFLYKNLYQELKKRYKI